MNLLDGKAVSRRLNKALKGRARQLQRPPGLAVVLVGADAASQVYVRRKGTVAGRLGFVHRQIDLDATVDQGTLLGCLDELNADDAIDGILVQLPLPRHIDASAVIDRIDPAKDVDGLSVHSVGMLSQGRPQLVPCTPQGVMVMLNDAGIELPGKRAVVIGRSNIVGRPMAMLLEQAHCTVTVCHSRTRGLPGLVACADVVVAAVGVPGMVRGSWLKPGAVVVDVGINRLDDGRLVGDVDPAGCEHVGWLAPVPGGVGPMTIAMLMHNTFRASLARQAAR